MTREMASSCILTVCVLMCVFTRASCGSIVPCVNFTGGPYEVTEGGGSMVIMLELTGGDNITVTITPSPADVNGAIVSDDYTISPLTLTFTDTNATQTVSISALNDSIVEATESFTLSLSSSVDTVTLGDAVTVNIIDNTEAIVEFDSAFYNVLEGDSLSVTVSVRSDVTLERNIEVTLMTVGDTATDGLDYMGITGDTLTFTPTVMSHTVMISAITDSIVEVTESFTLSLSSVDTVTLGDAITVNITDNTVAIVELDNTFYNVLEGDSLSVTVSVKPDVTLERNIEVTLMTVEDTATVDVDYMGITGDTLTFTPTVMSHTVMISAITDSIVEVTESFTLSLSSDDNVTLGDAVTVNITDNTVAIVELDSTFYNVLEGDSLSVTVSVKPDVTLERNIEVTLMTVEDTATVDVDYMGITGDTLTFTPTDMNHTVMISAITDDIVEGEETFSLTLTSTDDGPLNLLTPDASVSLDDNTFVTVTFNEATYSVTEGESATVIVDMESTLDVGVTVNLVVNVMSDDYTISTTQLTFTSDDISEELTINALLDSVMEVVETSSVTLTHDDGIYMFNDTSFDVDISDATVVLGFMEVTYNFMEGEASATVVVQVTSNPTDTAVNVSITNQEGGTATVGDDYMMVDLTPSISSDYSFTVTINEDDEIESEIFTLLLATDEDGVSISQSTTVITITDTTIDVTVNTQSVTVAEGESTLVMVTTTSEIDNPFNISISSANSLDDIIISPMEITVTTNTKSFNITITAMEDNMVEGVENFDISFTTTAINVALPSNVMVVVEDLTVNLMESPQSQGVLVNGSVTMTCSYDSGYNIDIQWLKDGDTNIPGANLTTPSDGVGTTYLSTLTIDSVEFGDCGSYMCNATNIPSSSADLSVVELLNTSDPNPMSSVGAVGMLSCTIRGCGPFSIEWVVQNDSETEVPLPIDNTNSTVEGFSLLIDLMSIVTINTLGKIHTGPAQQCEVLYNDNTLLDSQMFDYDLENVEVMIERVSPDETINDSFTQGQNVTFNCTATNPPGVTRELIFSWVQTATIIRTAVTLQDTSREGIEVIDGNGSSILYFPNIQDDPEIEGVYMCRVTNRLPNDWVTENITVDVISGPVIEFPLSETVNVGNNFTLKCEERSSNPPLTNLTISLNGDVLVQSTTAPLEYIIDMPSLEDSGTIYQCMATNAIGVTTEDFELIVRDIPDSVVTIRDDLVTLLVSNVSWEAPNDNNDPINQYTINVCDLTDNDCIIHTSDVANIVLFVVPKHNYTVSITATNEVGSSEPSEMVIIEGAQPGDANATLMTTLITNKHVILEWTLPPLATNPQPVGAPDESEFNVTSYILSWRSETPITIDNGTADIYLFNVEPKDYGGGLFRLTVVYSNSFINDNLPSVAVINATIPEILDVPTINEEFKDFTEIDGGFGFMFSWNIPALLDNQDLLVGYNIFIDEVVDDGRRKRQTGPFDTVGPRETSYTFMNGEPFTPYSVSVDGVANVDGENIAVVALAEIGVMTGEGMPGAPGQPMVEDMGITWVRLQWEPPTNPQGIITSYTIRWNDGVREGATTDTSYIINELDGHTEYTVTVLAQNGFGPGDESSELTFTTNAGAVPPEISVTANTDAEQYTITIEPFDDQYGPLSYYEIYVVRIDTTPDTSDIDADSPDTFIANAANAGPGQGALLFAFGDDTTGTLEVNDTTIPFENRPLERGTNYYFFVRLYSNVDIAVFNDSVPVKPSQLLPKPTDGEPDNTIAIVAAILGVLAFVLVLVFVALLIFAFKGKITRKYSVIRSTNNRRLEDGDKGIELRRRTRNFTPVLDIGDPNAFTSAGQPTTLVCEVSGTPAPNIKWTHEGKPLEDERFLVLADHSLFIQDTCLEDEGTYLVTAENSTGATTAQIRLTVIKPSPPEPDPVHPPVPVDNFTEYFARMTANDGDDLEEEYPDLEPDFANTTYAAKLSINRNKNRYINIIPYDHSRVVLSLQENTPGSDYINSCYINGYKRANQYIASQGPTTTTLADFWRMVWEFDCPTIVMVTKLEEEDKKKCEQYWPSYGSTTYGNVQVTLKEAENLAEYSIRTFSVSPLAGQSSAQMPVREVKQFHFLKWPDHGVPNYATALLHFRKRVHQYHPEKRGPMVVHCSAGVGRTGTFITVDYCMEQIEAEGIVDIFNFVQQMRYKRNYMVQIPPQYEFIHEAINEAITCGDTSVKAPELKDWLTNMAPNPETGKTVLEEQFARLDTASPHDDEFDCSVAEVNKDKNRIQEHLPSNDQRVVLSSEDDMCDYISASYVDGYRQRNAFMITQGPMKETVGDFWRMVWEFKSAAIVMLTQLEEDGEEMCYKYWSDEVGEAAVFGMFNVELTSELRDLGDYCTRKIKLSPINKAQESRIVTQFHFTKWSRKVPPESPKPMIDMIDELQRVQRKSGNQPITVHCNDGLGRTGAFCTLYYVLDRVKTEQVVDVFQAVKTLRIQRTGLVENLDQFKFVHTATMEFLSNFSNYQNFK